MHRREWLAAAGSALLPGFATFKRQDTAVTLAGGTIYDGSGAPAYNANVVVRSGQIAAIGREITSDGEVLDIHGLVLAPGFIDIHSHTDRELLVDPRAESKVRQGVTTEVAGQDGSSVAPSSGNNGFARLGHFFGALGESGSAVNFASMVGHGTVRRHVMDAPDRPPSSSELARMIELVREALEDGACGLSSGLEYVPGAFATTDELVRLCEPLAPSGLPYSSHIRNEDDGLLSAAEEAIMIGARSGVHAHIAHLKAQGARNWWKADAVLAMVDHANARGHSVTFDRYPYVAYATGVSSLFPAWAREDGNDAFLARLDDENTGPRIEAFTRDKIALLGSWNAVQLHYDGTSPGVGDIDGRRLGDLARERGSDPYALLVTIVRERPSTGMIGFGMSEENTARMLAHPRCMICSDGSALATDGPLATGTPHPRSFGTFPRVLGHYVRDRRVMSLAEAIRKMTSAPARLLKLRDRGRIAIGAAADLVVFDATTVIDRATFARPKQYATGMHHVFVNGIPVLLHGERTEALPGRPLRPT